jgi:hypothetical protein
MFGINDNMVDLNISRKSMPGKHIAYMPGSNDDMADIFGPDSNEASGHEELCDHGSSH